MKKVITHNGRFHADDLFAIATLSLIFGDDMELIRTRDVDEINAADIVVDVGDQYDAEKGRFDHHQKVVKDGIRENGIPYAAFGLIWKHYGKDLCGDDEVLKIVEERIVMPLDAGDNGIQTFNVTEYNVSPYLLHDYFYSTQPLWNEEKSYDDAFKEALEIAKGILKREVERAKAFVIAKKDILDIYEKMNEKAIAIFDESIKYEDEDILKVLATFDEPKFIVVKVKSDNTWKVKALRKGADRNNTFKSRVSLPASWGGLRDEELQKVSGVRDAYFCHRKLFMCVAHSKEGAIKMAEIALKS